MKVALCQSNIQWNDPDLNLQCCAAFVEKAVQQSAKLILFPEMFLSGFSLLSGSLAEEVYRKGLAFLAETARTKGLSIGGTLPECAERGERPYNTFFIFGPAGEVLRYRKLHLFSFAAEEKHYTEGSVVQITQLEGLRVSPFICYDLRFAEVFSKVALQTDVYLVLANWPAGRQSHWEILLRARAIENQAYVIGVNRVGEGGGLSYKGGSAIINPLGEYVARGGDREEMIVGELQASELRRVRQEFPFLQDRRAWSELTMAVDLKSRPT